METPIKITDANFVKLSASERLKAITNTTHGYMLIVGLVAVALSIAASIFPFLSQLQGPGPSYARDREVLREASANLEEAYQLLGQGGDHNKGIVLLGRSKDLLNLYISQSSKRQSLTVPKEGFGLITSAHAQDKPLALPNEVRRWILGLVLLTLVAVFVGSLFAILFVKEAEILRFAFDTVKTLMGFFIGVATTLIGSS